MRYSTTMLKPLDDYMLVRDIDEEQKTSAGIILAQTATNKGVAKAEVLALGPGRRDKDGVNPMDVKVGDVILYPRGEGEELKNGERLLQERKILLTVKDDELIPYWDKVLVELAEPETSKSGIILVAPVERAYEHGRVVAVGPGYVTEGHRDPSELAGGERVLFSQFAAMEINLGVASTRKLFITRDNEIMAIIEETAS